MSSVATHVDQIGGPIFIPPAAPTNAVSVFVDWPHALIFLSALRTYLSSLCESTGHVDCLLPGLMPCPWLISHEFTICTLLADDFHDPTRPEEQGRGGEGGARRGDETGGARMDSFYRAFQDED
jgi:hypothetical protein